jgi:hypothetical protein
LFRAEKYLFPKGMLMSGGIHNYKDLTPMVLKMKSRRDLILAAEE